MRTTNGRTYRPISKLYPLAEMAEPVDQIVESSVEIHIFLQTETPAAVAANARYREMAADNYTISLAPDNYGDESNLISFFYIFLIVFYRLN